MADGIVDEVMRLMGERGDEEYYGEQVSQLEHALQAAHLAVSAGEGPEQVVAALLHDVGHLLHGEGEDAAEQGIDTRHEDDGYRWLRERFGPAVAEPVRLHVAAKRYLCAVDPGYPGKLSPASALSLKLQGGAFGEEEARAFEREPFYREAVALRRRDDEAKVPGLDVPGLEAYGAALRLA